MVKESTNSLWWATKLKNIDTVKHGSKQNTDTRIEELEMENAGLIQELERIKNEAYSK